MCLCLIITVVMLPPQVAVLPYLHIEYALHRCSFTLACGDTTHHHISLWYCCYNNGHTATGSEQAQEQALHVQTELWASLGVATPPPSPR